MPSGGTCSLCVCVAGWSRHALGVYNFLLHAMQWVHPVIPGWSKWLITMVSFLPLSRVVPLPNGHSWLINGGDPNHLQVLGWTSKYTPAYRGYNLTYSWLGPTFSLLGKLWGLPISIFHRPLIDIFPAKVRTPTKFNSEFTIVYSRMYFKHHFFKRGGNYTGAQGPFHFLRAMLIELQECKYQIFPNIQGVSASSTHTGAGFLSVNSTSTKATWRFNVLGNCVGTACFIGISSKFYKQRIVQSAQNSLYSLYYYPKTIQY